MRKRMLAPAIALLLTAGIGAGPSAGPPECVLAAAWVRAHADALPPPSPSSRPFRWHTDAPSTARFLPEERVSLWREQMTPFAQPGSGLSDRQRAAVREVIARLPALHTAGSGPVEARALGARIIPLFDPELAARIFTRLGPAPAPSAQSALTCSCSRNSSVGCEGGQCVAFSCHILASGCGLGGAEPCDGFCEM